MFVSQKVIIFNKGGKFLAIRRSKTDPSRPLTWDFTGGEVEEGEDLEENIFREVKEEVGIDITDLQIFDVVGTYNKKGEYWVGIGYTAKAVSDNVTLSYEHDQFEWLTKEEFLKRESSPKLVRFVSKL
ncbi:MAG: NUDIX domain-containing protein [Parcubacteria group bacterium]|nr:NUDIX domain-containing protein [Parcubacteria group bacterium]